MSQNKFAKRDVGITHPDNNSFIRIAENGDIYIMAQDNLGIIISATQQSILLVGDSVKFLTKDYEGLKWNRLSFNPKATKYSEPALLFSKQQENPLYSGLDHFIGE